MVVQKSITISCFDLIGPVMIGPSSSHTAGACRIGAWARRICGEPIQAVTFTLYGSFARTWRGHGTDRALLAGVMNMDVDDPNIRCAYELAEAAHLDYRFIEDVETVTDHPNTVKIDLITQQGEEISVVGESIGGGRAKITAINGIQVKFNARLNAMLVVQQDQPGLLAHIATSCANRMVNIAFLNLFRSDRALDAYTLVETDDLISQDLLLALQDHPLIKRVILLENDVNPAVANDLNAAEPWMNEDETYLFSSVDEAKLICEQHGIDLAELMMRREIKLSGRDRTSIEADLHRIWTVMNQSIEEPLTEKRISMGGLIGGEGATVMKTIEAGQSLMGLGSRAIAYALSVLEQNASMGLIVAAPTAGASGVLPACLKALSEAQEIEDEAVICALMVAAFVAFMIQLGFSLSGAEGGCQAEVGSASAMAAASVVYLMAGQINAQLAAASMVLMNLLGLVCDPIGGLVEVPCQFRNAGGASMALSCAQIALSGVDSVLPFDEMIGVCQRVGQSIPIQLKETAMGGVAASPTAKRCRGCSI